MRLSLLSALLLCCTTSSFSGSLPSPAEKQKVAFTHNEKDFLLNGTPLRLLSGELHYPRVPREYWRDRIRRAKAMGLNTICTYIFWNLHEPKPGQWDFSGNLDIVEFCRIAQEEGMWVIVRPGPYVCAEWEWGGYPAWLLKSPDIEVRSTDPRFMEPAVRYLKKVSGLLAPLQSSKGGPIIMAQVENEYGSFGGDKEFLKAHEQAMKDGGLDATLLFTADGPNDGMIANGTLPHLFSAMNFGGGAKEAFANYKKHRPNAPLMCGEFWCGWFDHWGAPHSTGNTESQAQSLEWMMDNNASVNFYMVHGGTSFGFMNGANWTGKHTPDVTSYDYGAPIGEDGRLTPRYYRFRDIIQKHLDAPLPQPPAPLPSISIPSISFARAEQAPLMGNLPRAVRSEAPVRMEALGQSYGFILYRTEVTGPVKGTLKMPGMQDRVIASLDGKKQGVADRRHNRDSLELDVPAGKHTLDLLVENLGRINFSTAMRGERKGLGPTVTLAGKPLSGFDIYPLPCDDLSALKFGQTPPSGEKQPVFYKTEFLLDETGDAFLDMQDGWEKGVVWVNGRNLGRFWKIGAQQTLFCPGPWLKKGRNEIVVLDLDGAKGDIRGVTDQIWKTNPEELGSKHRQPGETVTVGGLTPVHKASFAEGETRQLVTFPAPAQGRYVAFELYSAHDGSPFASMAELVLRDTEGNNIPQEECKVIYADSEETSSEAASADYLFDNQPTTHWHTEWSSAKPPYPHLIVIDMGKGRTLGGFHYIPRQDRPNGRVKDYAVFTSCNPFPGQKK